MRPIELKADLNFLQALRCAQYRMPRSGVLSPTAYFHALSLRYGLIGAAASHHLLLSSSDDEEPHLIDAIAGWPHAVEEHIRWEGLPKSQHAPDPFLPGRLGNQAYIPLVIYLAGYRCLKPLEDCLREAANVYTNENIDEIRSGWKLFSWRRPIKEFQRLSDESIHYAMGFFERRQAGIEEVPEIALLGE